MSGFLNHKYYIFDQIAILDKCCPTAVIYYIY
jgi:hypothetical protein